MVSVIRVLGNIKDRTMVKRTTDQVHEHGYCQ